MADEEDPAYTIVEYMSDHSGYKCGYCKSKSTNFSHGMWAHRMTVGDYQDLIDRGWRRSGKYCYKPTMNKTCCPMYTIKCDALELKLSKTQKKVLKRMHRYLNSGDLKNEGGAGSQGNDSCESPQGNQEYVKPKFDTTKDLSSVSFSTSAKKLSKGAIPVNIKNSVRSSSPSFEANEQENNPISTSQETQGHQVTCLSTKTANKVSGPDSTKPPCKKAKVIRRELREAKLAKRREEAISRGENLMDVVKPKPSNNTPKSLEDFLNEPLPDNPAHTLELRLVRVNPPEVSFKASYNASYGVYRNYQLEIHHDSESECDRSSYQSFLVDGPLVAWHPECGPPQGYGSFHHQYWLDGRLIAIGVLDILPYCVSSVYLYYDPAFSFLSLGTYASLRELALTRELHRSAPKLKWYYMGFYIHSCPKMRYKGNYTPSYLLCPETYAWFPIQQAAPKLEISKYSRFSEDLTATDPNNEVDLDRIKILYDHDLILYETYREVNPDSDDEEQVQEYAALVGAKNAYSMILYRS